MYAQPVDPYQQQAMMQQQQAMLMQSKLADPKNMADAAQTAQDMQIQSENPEPQPQWALNSADQ